MATDNDTTLRAVLGTLTTLGIISLVLLPRLVRRMPAPGPRLREGEVSAGDATGQAEKLLWKAEGAAAKGKCQVAREVYAEADVYRTMAKERAARGDLTGRDLRNAIRSARVEIRRCHD